MHIGYILFCVHFQTNSSLVWKKIQNFDDSFSKPIPVWFGKNDHISEAKNSKLIIIWTKESWFPASVTGSSFLKLCWYDSIRWAGWRGDAQWGRGCQQGGRQGVALSVEVGVCDQLGDNIGCWVSLRWWQADVRDWRGVGVGGVGGWSPRSRVRLKVLLKTANFICFRWVDIIQVSVSIPLVRCASGNVYVLNTFRCSNIRAMPTAHLGSITDAEKVKVKWIQNGHGLGLHTQGQKAKSSLNKIDWNVWFCKKGKLTFIF